MTQISPARISTGIQEEEVDFRSPISENTWTRVGGSINFINERQVDTHQWVLNGRYSLFGVKAGPDGILPVLFDMEIVGYSVYNETVGTSGTTILDIHKLSSGGTDDGSIFSTRPAVDFNAASGSYSLIRLDPAADLQLPTGHTKAVFSSINFSAGESLRLDLDSAMQNGRNISLQLLFRPI